MRVELTTAEADQQIHPHHHELWVRVLSKEPLETTHWEHIKLRSEVVEALAGFAHTPCAFYAYDEPEDEYSFEQYWILPSVGKTA